MIVSDARRARRFLLPFTFLLLPCLLSGCAVFGIAAQALPAPTVKPVYTGFRDQTVGVMVWADRGMRVDNPPLPIDVANSLQVKLVKSEAKELKGATFPVKPASIVKYQQDYPEIEAEPITDVAPRLGVARLIYIEVEDFSTRSPGAVELFRGSAEVSLRVVEVKDGVGKVVYEENGITATFPEKVPAEGIPNASDRKIYMGTVDTLTGILARKFVSYAEER